jgi:regulator of sigma E protease
MDSVLQLIFALIGLGFLVFIHELGHYWAARKVGMKVEVFSIGFGKPIYQWVRDGVKWQIGWLPIGGYVKIAGTDLGGNGKDAEGRDPYMIPDGFFGKKPIQRIFVALAGPVANLILAFILFAFIWLGGGRDKPFHEFTQRAGWVDPRSELYEKGIRPGDLITTYNGHPLRGYKDLLYAALLSGKPIDLRGYMVDPVNASRTGFNLTVKPYQYPGAAEGMLTVGVSPAHYLIYKSLPEEQNGFMAGSPMVDSGIQAGDQIVWANGDQVFSLEQLSELVNEPLALLTVKRGHETFLARVPRVQLNELKLDAAMHGELTDWQHQAKLKSKFAQLYFIPYNLNLDAVVEGPVAFIDPETQSKATPAKPKTASLDVPLLSGDQIIAVNGTPVVHSFQLLSALQEQQVVLIVNRTKPAAELTSWKDADRIFDQSYMMGDIRAITGSLGMPQPVRQSGEYYLLGPITPKSMADFALSPEQKAMLAAEMLEHRKKAEALSDPDKRARALRALEDSQKRLVLGVALVDRQVNYNPPPYVLFDNVFTETWRTMLSLFSGYLNPKWLSGPVGIVKVIQNGWSIGVGEALFWIAAISVNLGMLNLLPIPFLDGGHILFSLFEMVTGKRIKPKVLEKLILPFVIILIGFIIFVTYYDIARLF